MTRNEIVLVVSVSIIHKDKLLMIKENKASVKNTWNFPSGRIEYGEHILEAVRREAKEETGYDVKLTATTGIYNFISSTNHQVILLHFIGEIIGGSLHLDTTEIIDSKWIALTDLLIPDLLELRDNGVIKQIKENLISEKEYSLALFNRYLEHMV
ncbi:NUDIX domain-containing protein [Paenibacillus taichungensis]|uniref:NUDIX hydrolase n=1 Tax=Paenibacillus taichungensis TaxID=484184 RepID=UPI002DB56AEF|nr:NUDIX domain-containing protein [Paenibacillus taichungensis]MEC0111518.1 NUDIX domain-containing protein [Paenibacillus taichungensis]MEC0196965.1 NUDIX domain-containing protein [Paenibacillus taichungensis]